MELFPCSSVPKDAWTLVDMHYFNQPWFAFGVLIAISLFATVSALTGQLFFGRSLATVLIALQSPSRPLSRRSQGLRETKANEASDIDFRHCLEGRRKAY